MTKQWNAVDRYIDETVVGSDPALEAAHAACAAAGLPAIAVSPSQGKLLMLLARMQNAKAILEIGTLGAYSTIWLARGLAEGGRLITLEADPRHAEVARANLARAGLSQSTEVRLGLAAELLPRIAAAGEGPFDLVFIDADKPNNPLYFDWALKLARKGSVIVVDNVVRDGRLADAASDEAASDEAAIMATRKMFEQVAREPKVSATAIQTVGAKGYDGFLLARVEAA